MRGPTYDALLSAVKPLAISCLAFALASCTDVPETGSAAFRPLGNEAAWNRMPRATPALPVWARTLVDSLPRTTALLLDLDRLHRTGNPLGPELAARLRWIVAEANQCAYAQESARADLVRAGLDAEQLASLGAIESLPDKERRALDFARNLTLAASSITDADVGDLIEAHGADDVVAIVHTIALANFEDRLFLGLGLTTEPGGPVPPRDVRPTVDSEFVAPARAVPADSGSTREIAASSLGSWGAHSADELRALLEQQKNRQPRIPDPGADRLAGLAHGERRRVDRIAWSRVSVGYQPELTHGWFAALKAFNQEAGLDEVFANSLFWVVTRTSDCFY